MNGTYLSGRAEDQPTPAGQLETKRVLVFLSAGFEDAEAVCLLDVLGWTRYRPSIATVEVELTGFHDEVQGAFGSRFRIDVPFNQVDPRRYDALAIPGGFHNLGFEEAHDGRLGQLARAFFQRGCPIATFCVGVLPLAREGLLDGGQATTYAFSSRHDNVGVLRQGGCDARAQAVVDWHGIMSCSGPAYSQQVSYLLLQKLIGEDAAAEVRRFRRGCETAGQ